MLEWLKYTSPDYSQIPCQNRKLPSKWRKRKFHLFLAKDKDEQEWKPYLPWRGQERNGKQDKINVYKKFDKLTNL